MGGVGARRRARRARAPLNHEFTITLFGHSMGLFGTEGLLPQRRRLRRRSVHALPLPDGVHGHGRDHPHRRDGGTLEVLGVLRFRLLHGDVRLSDLRQLGVGRRLAGDARRELRSRPRPRGLRRVVGRAHGRRRRRARRARSCSVRASASSRRTGDPIAIPGHDIPMAIAGTFILAFGWFGFNPGSTLAGGDLRIARRRRQHDAGRRRWRASPRCSSCGEVRQARSRA